MSRPAPTIFWEIVYEPDEKRRIALADAFIEAIHAEEDTTWIEAQTNYVSTKLKAGRRAANSARKDEADAAVLAAFAEWQSRRRAALADETGPLSAADRVRKYLRTQKLPDRTRRRLRALVKLGRIPALT